MDIKYIDWSQFSNTNIIEKGVCEGKICCIIVTYKNKKYVLKEFSDTSNSGIDYVVVDECKKCFGLNHMNMTVIKSNKGLVKLDDTTKGYAFNCSISEKECIYYMMDYWDNIGDMRKYIDIVDPSVVYECIKIILFNVLFLSSDNNIRNILINEDHKLLSIDEDDLFGKTKFIFQKSVWPKKEKFRDMIYSIIDDFLKNKDTIKSNVKMIFEKYNFDKIDVFNDRLDNFKDLVISEF